eukprot:Colp12_sorted_trinity150504_noHs@30298
MLDVESIFESLSAQVGFPVDQLKLVTCMTLAYPLGCYQYSCNKSVPFKHALSAAIGFIFGWLCFKTAFLHFVAIAIVCYLMVRFFDSKTAIFSVFVYSMTHLSACHIYRQYVDYGGWELDVTGPLMILVIKVTSFAFNIYDGKRMSECIDEHKRYALTRMPSFLEYLGYTFFYGGILAGPPFECKDYLECIDGTAFKKSDGTISKPPLKDVVAAALGKGLFALLNMLGAVLSQGYGPGFLETEEYYQSSFLYRVLIMNVVTTLLRCKYYFAWLYAEGSCICAGIGFNGWDSSGRARFDRVTNCQIINLETAQSIKGITDNWNTGTGLWLRRYVYLRLTPPGMRPTFFANLITYAVSAFWHGFYPGYYMMFITAALMGSTAKDLRFHLRPYFAGGKLSAFKWLYDILSWVLTMNATNYVCIIFAMLDFHRGLRLWTSLYFYVHAVLFSIIAFYLVFPQFVRKQPKVTKVN